jgi:hypothetical protein
VGLALERVRAALGTCSVLTAKFSSDEDEPAPPDSGTISRTPKKSATSRWTAMEMIYATLRRRRIPASLRR